MIIIHSPLPWEVDPNLDKSGTTLFDHNGHPVLRLILSSSEYQATRMMANIKLISGAIAAVQLLIEAYEKGAEKGGSIEWSDLDAAYELAVQAVAPIDHLDPPIRTLDTAPQHILEGKSR